MEKAELFIFLLVIGSIISELLNSGTGFIKGFIMKTWLELLPINFIKSYD
jgi:hypothetical protein